MTNAEAIMATLQSPNVSDSNGEAANVVDTLSRVASGLFAVRSAITPADASQGRDAAGGTVTSLTEAVMGITAGLCRVASALEGIAEAIREGGES